MHEPAGALGDLGTLIPLVVPYVSLLKMDPAGIRLTVGNALIAITEENNRLVADRPVSERRVAFSTGVMNLGSSLLGGIPMCHDAGGLAGT